MNDALKILMLEDNHADAEMVQRLLKKEKLHFEFRLVMNKDAFLLALDEFQPDIILSDNSLPQFNATEAIEIIQQRSEHIPCILITGTISEEFAAGIIKLGADDYILKDRLGRLPAAIDAAIKHQKAEKEKKNALIELKRSEENLRALVERVSDAFVALDANWKFIYVNKKGGEILNRAPDELLNKHIWTEFPEGFGKQFNKFYREAMVKQTNLHIEEYSEVFDKWFQNHIYSSRSGISIYIRDITKIKKVQKELQTTQDHLLFHLENSPLAFIEWDNQFRPISWSSRANEIFGWTEKEAAKLDWFSHVYEEDLPCVRKITEQLITGKISKSQAQYRNYTKDGEVIWCEWFNSILRDNDGKVITMQSLIMDITKRKEAEENLKRSEMRSNEAQAMAQIGNWEIDFTQNIQSWSDELYKIFRIKKDEVEASTELFLSLIHADDVGFAQQKVIEAIESLKESSFNFRFIRKDGLTRHGHCAWKFEFDKNRKPLRLYGIVQDVSERKMAEIDRTKMVNELIHRNKDLEQFAYIVSHNLRAPSADILDAVNAFDRSVLSIEEKDIISQGLNQPVTNL